MLTVIRLIVIMSNVVYLNNGLKVVQLTVYILSVIILSVIMLSNVVPK
jgi:hypothetical protein